MTRFGLLDFSSGLNYHVTLSYRPDHKFINFNSVVLFVIYLRCISKGNTNVVWPSLEIIVLVYRVPSYVDLGVCHNLKYTL